ncbi:hypothetical protein ABID14_000336 [Peptoniphilus olsenii]|uniref:Uncharacterized protein n=1 Tax=Peptoniphilus olsenii TaxID=411570 RepID=A0ABV2J7F9_9FIRM
MYKYIQSGCEIIWQPRDKNLGFEIVKEVTGIKGDEEHLTVVDNEQRDKIQKLYAERNHDIVEETEEITEEKAGIAETLTKEISTLKIERMKDDKIKNN